MPTKHLLIKGKVQGVYYRSTAKDMAKKMKITGWIRNTTQGDVEATVTGTNEQLDSFITWCRQGPTQAIVTEVQITAREEEAFNAFIIAH